MKEARYYERVDTQDAVRCLLCPKRCFIRPGASGLCRTRKNVEGKLYSTIYGEYTSIALDPMEKKPLYHFYPGSTVLSLGTRGCNLLCKFCQNWEISQGNAPTEHIEPGEITALAKKYRDRARCVGIAYTYSEPVVWYEFVTDTARLAHEEGLRNVLVTNGEINPEPLDELLPYIDAMNIDVKGFRDEFYRKICGGSLEPVLKTVELAARKCHVEVTNLIIPGLNDSPGEIAELVDWLSGLGDHIPIHFSRYFPNYKLDLPPTPLETLRMAGEIARKKLKYVYLGNVREPGGNDTFCYRCGRVVIKRVGFQIAERHLENGSCEYCGARIHIVE
ncbi:MAG TPA: AmmeMemoRadiSam system radical SAM enzyme [Firmicutes bacterium]|nr:AmmeMemoRadiSam system radical SAM enzyme [Bacillota bacterium]